MRRRALVARRSRERPGPTAASSAAGRRRSSRARAQRERKGRARSLLRELLSRGADFLFDLALVDRVAVAGERARERGDRVVEASELEQDVAVVILDDRVGAQLVRGALQTLFGEIE